MPIPEQTNPASEYLKSKKAWEESRPKPPSLQYGDLEKESVEVNSDGNMLISGYNEDGDTVYLRIDQEQAFKIALWIRETFLLIQCSRQDRILL